MSRTLPREATGLQVVVFVFAILVLGAAAARFVGDPLARIATLIVAGSILFGVPALRRRCLGLLAAPAKPGAAIEVGTALAIQIVCGFGFFGAMALWWWAIGGEPALARHMGQGFVEGHPWERAFSAERLTHIFLVGGILAPVVEELVFRGILYPTWERKWGWVKSAIATSTIFGLIHPAVVPQFLSSLVLIALYRRTGSLRACIACHSALNIVVWYPLLGQFMVPGAARETGELHAWALNLACLLMGFFALCIYLWRARDDAVAG